MLMSPDATVSQRRPADSPRAVVVQPQHAMWRIGILALRFILRTVRDERNDLS